MRPAHYAREVVGNVLSGSLLDSAASMRPAHYAREVDKHGTSMPIPAFASMRPAHYAREVVQMQTSIRALMDGFNEARALCAGSQVYVGVGSGGGNRFNEARALCAGSRFRDTWLDI